MNIFFFLGLLFMLITLVTLFMGFGTLAKGGDFNRKHGNKLMRARVICQGIAVACFFLWAVT
ncbi:MAG: twin transmembrane helix small protein [Alphaproteobacteria bacterium]|nr:twin transmembrane helix small protein [Alphaproteobacteria bacterium]